MKYKKATVGKLKEGSKVNWIVPGCQNSHRNQFCSVTVVIVFSFTALPQGWGSQVQQSGENKKTIAMPSFRTKEPQKRSSADLEYSYQFRRKGAERDALILCINPQVD